MECDSVSYELVEDKRTDSLFMYHIIRKNLNKSEFSNYTFDYISKNLIAFNINYESLSYKEVSELPKTTFTNLIGDLGGIIGNFLYIF